MPGSLLLFKTMNTLLLATDFSKSADNAAEYAAQLARFLNARLIIVHAFSLPLGGYDVTAPLETISEMRANAIKKLELLRGQLTSNNCDFGIDIRAELGFVFEVIKDAAGELKVGLIVMGMNGEADPVKKHLIGSNTLQAARNLACPVLIVSEEVRYKPVHTVSLAADMKDIKGKRLLYSARGIAGVFNAALEVVTVEKRKEKVWTRPGSYSFVDRRLKDTQHRQVYLRDDDVALALEYYFKFHETDLVIVNPKKHSVFQKLFSESITKHLAFHSRVPLLVIH